MAIAKYNPDYKDNGNDEGRCNWQYFYDDVISILLLFSETLRAMTYLINSGMVMYWGTAKWTPVELFEAFSQARSFHCVPPVCEYAEYHPFHREKV